MEMQLDGKNMHWATGGATAKPDAPVLVLIHGAGMDSTVWQLQSRYLAHRGVRVIALDLPGHGASEGPVLKSIEDMADWLIRFLSAADIGNASLAGHSMGALIALAAAAKAPERVSRLALLGIAAEMPVHPDLIAAAEAGGPLAPELIADWGFAAGYHTGGHPHPGLWAMGAGIRLLRNAAPGVLASDLRACDSYKDALAAAAGISSPVLLIAAVEDRMTPLKGARPLVAALADGEMTVLTETGHMMMIERPNDVAKLLLGYVAGTASNV